MRLLILTPEYRGAGGGIITYYQALVPALRDQGVEVHVVEGSGMHAVQNPEVRLEEGIRTEMLAYDRLARWHERFTAYAAAPGLRRHMAAAWAMWEQAGYGEGCDVVEACDFGLSFIPSAIEGGRPLVVHCHGSLGQIAVHDPIRESETEGLLVRLLERAVLQHVRTIETCSASNARFWEAETGQRVVAVPPPLTVPPFAAASDVSDRGLVVGRLQRWKGPHVLCEALERLGLSAPGVDWIGRDTPWDSTEQWSAAHLAAAFPGAWGSTLRHLPPVDRREVARRQAAARFNVVPSTWDVFNYTVAEALASGRPTIVSNGAGASDLVESGRNGFVFEAGNAASLAGALEHLLGQSPGRLRNIGAAGRETVAREMDPAAVARRRIETYREAIDAFTSAPPAPPIPDGLSGICRQAVTASGDFAFLNQFPLRALIAHVADRLGAKARSRSPLRLTRR